MTSPITTAPAATSRAMHAAEMRGLDMQDDLDEIYVDMSNAHQGQGMWESMPFLINPNSPKYITEAECQRRIDAAVTAEIANASVMFEQTVADLVKALKSADTYIDKGHYEMARNITRNAIRARGQK